MRRITAKIISTPSSLITVEADNAAIVALGNQLRRRIGHLFKGSLAIREVDAGSDNACEYELNALTNSFYDIERFGIHFVASPRHADMLMVTGPVSRNMVTALQSAYNATPDPKIIVAVGDDAIDGGIFKGNYAVVDGVQAVIPVDYAIPGDPPSPLTIMQGLLFILNDPGLQKRVKGKR